MLIERIDKIKNKKELYLVTFSDATKVEIVDEMIFKFGLTENEEIPDDILDAAIAETQFYRAKSLALRKLNNKPRTKLEIICFLNQLEYKESVIQKVIQFLEEYNITDDEKYAEDYVLESINKGKGKQRIISEMLEKGISPSLMKKNIQNYIDENREEENALNEAKKKIDKTGLNEKTLPSVGRYLLAKGYEEELVNKILERLLNQAEDSIE